MMSYSREFAAIGMLLKFLTEFMELTSITVPHDTDPKDVQHPVFRSMGQINEGCPNIFWLSCASKDESNS